MDAYDVEKIQSFKKLGLTVECIEAYDDTLLVVIEGGQLRKYNVKFIYDIQKDKQKVKLECETFPSMFSKPVTKMFLLTRSRRERRREKQEFADNMLNVHDLDSFELKSQLTSTKGVTQFDVVAKESVSQNQRFQARVTAELCAAVGKKLKMFLLNNDKFDEIASDMVLVSPPKALLWCKKNLFIGLKSEYFVMRPKTDQIHDVFAYDSQQKEPLMTKIDDDTVLLGYSNRSIYVNRLGKPVRDASVVWSGIPQHLVYDKPYLVAVLPRYIEVKSANPSYSIQQMDVKNVESICQGSGITFLKTAHSIYSITMKPLKERLKYIIQHKYFELAVQAVEYSDLHTEEKNQEIYKLQTHNGVHQFYLQKFEESMQIFMSLNTDPSHVVGMFPDLLPTKLRQSFEYPDKLPQLQGHDLDRALLALVDYLKEKRDYANQLGEIVEFKPILTVEKKDKNQTLKSKDQALNVIDTTLLKCYLQVNEALIAPLLRTPGNKVHPKVAEKVLKQNQKFSDLIILYEQEQMHKEALDMIKEQSTKTKSPLYGTAMAVYYLQQLDANNLQLIFDHAQWVVEMDAYDGLKIFTEDRLEPAVDLPRGHVLSFMKNYCQELVIPYLEHVIYKWNDETEEFHDELAAQLRDRVTKSYNRRAQFKSKRVKHIPTDRVSEKFDRYRQQMMRFFTYSTIYKPEKVLTKFPFDSFFEERAVVLGRMNQHEQVLGIYIYILNELAEAEEYCFKKHKDGHQDVYLDLLKVYLCPPESSSLGLTSYDAPPQPDMLAALSVLQNHAAHLDIQKICSGIYLFTNKWGPQVEKPVSDKSIGVSRTLKFIRTQKVLDILPDELLMRKVAMFLDSSMQSRVSLNRMYQIRKRMQIIEFVEAYGRKRDLCKKMIYLDDEKSCEECNLKIGRSFFAHKPDGSIVHYGCVKDIPTS